ncbi:integral membrane protein [Colletotrichum kahawae]|uniref:Integral membrane protein n=1 Tax=Colletotrichum kahawae TaxID=34407 RepID=A0AAE0D779_COLKA|nr:integral membrane protein [Colletotrichum kahawae]
MRLTTTPRIGVAAPFLLGTLISTASAAYLQFQDCYDGSSALRLTPEGLRAALDNSESVTRLYLNLTGSYPGVKTCDLVPHSNVSANVEITSLTASKSYTVHKLTTTCHETNYPNHDVALIRHQMTFLLDPPSPIDSYDLNLHLSSSSQPFSCVTATITPALSPTAKSIAQYLPPATLLLTLLLALWHELLPLDTPSQTFHGPFISSPSPTHLTLISQCLTTIQFLFLSTSLTIPYPSFLRPLAAPSSWSTLMIPRGPVHSATPYFGLKDALYEVTGTLTASPGLELMTQILGAPVTPRSWANTLTLAAALLLATAAAAQLALRRPSNRARAARLRGTTDPGLRGTVWTVLRVFLTYFLTPVTAWSTYQLTAASFLPVYHTVLTALVVALLVAALWWGITQNSPRNMGYLLLDASKTPQTPGRLSRSQDRYAMAMFALMFVRGAAVGGLQMAGAGVVQVLVLAACEVVQLLVMGFTWRCVPVLRVGGALSAARLVVLGLFVGFLPGVVGEVRVRNVLGLVVLGVHGLVVWACLCCLGWLGLGL